MELLSPAGNEEALTAAVQSGADAVYFGGRALGARAQASFFFGPALYRAVEYCHLRGVKAYLTVNTLVKEGEMDGALEMVAEAVDAGVDAYLVQDLGLLSLLRQSFPGIRLHASTQMSLNNASGAAMALRLGVSRVVAARECGLEELRAMAATGAEVEAFAHGALCMGFSGQCLFSSSIGGRSGNRGRCAQPCRLPYELNGENCYALSPKDLCAMHDLKALRDAGVCSIKLEGRLKRPEYVAVVTAAYRRALDRLEEGKGPDPADDGELLAVFNRGGFTRGFAFGERDGETLSQERPNHRGVYAGRLIKVSRGEGLAALDTPLHEGDGLEARAGELGVGISVSDLHTERGLTRLRVPEGARAGMELWRTTDAEQMERARRSVQGEHRRREVSLRAELCIGRPARLWMDDVETAGETVQAARSRPLTPEDVEKQLTKLGDTVLACGKIRVEMDENAFLPVSALNELRRRAAEAYQKRLLERAKPRVESGEAIEPQRRQKTRETLLVHQSRDLDELLVSPADELYWQAMDLREESLRDGLRRLPKGHSFLVLPPYLTEAELEYVEKLLSETEGVGVVANNLSQLGRFAGRRVRAGEGLNAFNPRTAALLMDLGAERVCVSLECTLTQAKSMADHAPVELNVYGVPTLLCARSCPIRAKAGLGAKGRENCSLCGGGGAELTDRKGERLHLTPCRTAGGCTLYLDAARPIDAFPRLQPQDIKPFAAVKAVGSAQEARYVFSRMRGEEARRPEERALPGWLFRGVG